MKTSTMLFIAAGIGGAVILLPRLMASPAPAMPPPQPVGNQTASVLGGLIGLAGDVVKTFGHGSPKPTTPGQASSAGTSLVAGITTTAQGQPLSWGDRYDGGAIG